MEMKEWLDSRYPPRGLNPATEHPRPLYDNCLACQHRIAMLALYGDKLSQFPTVAADIRALALICQGWHGVPLADYGVGGRKYVIGGWKK